MRMPIKAILAAAVLATGGCVGQQQIAYDREFLQLERARGAARAADDTATVESAELALAKLGSDARKAAEGAHKDGRPQDAIALYRVAASAAWKSGQGETVAIAQGGLDICREVRNSPRDSPRDCLFLRMVAPMASIDQRSAQISAFADIWQRLTPARRAVEAAKTRDYAFDIVAATKNLNGIRAEVEAPAWAEVLPPRMLLYLDEQVRRGYCHAYRASLVLARNEFGRLGREVDGARADSKLKDEVIRRAGLPAGTGDAALCHEILR